MTAGDGLLARLKRRKLGQWALAYIAGAWALLQGLDLVAQNFDLPHVIFRAVVTVRAAGLPAVLVLAWYHGEKGRQRVSGVELLMLSGILVIAGSALTFVARAGRRGDSAAHGSAVDAVEKSSIAVLPFLDLSPKQDQEYFSDGLTEELLNTLAQVPALRVAARTSSFAFKGKDVEIDSIGRALRVAKVLEGSVRTDGRRVRITAQLIDARTNYHLWSQTYDGDLKDIFALQSRISSAIAEQLRLKLGTPEGPVAPGATTADPDAYTLVLRAIQSRRTATAESLHQAEMLLNEAVRRDPNYARAYALLADVYQYQAYRRFAPREERYRLAQAQAQRALALDPRDALAHEVLGWIAGNHQWDFQAADEQYRLALQSNPSEAVVHAHRAWFLARMHRMDEALAEASRAATLDPISPQILNNVAATYIFAGQHEKAIRLLKSAVALDSANPISFGNLAIDYAWLGDTAQASRNLEAVLRLAPGDDFARAAAAYVYARAGRRAEALSQLRALEGKHDTSPYLLAGPWLALGDRERALALLARAVRARDDFAADAAIDPVFTPLNSDPRFQRILSEGGLK